MRAARFDVVSMLARRSCMMASGTAVSANSTPSPMPGPLRRVEGVRDVALTVGIPFQLVRLIDCDPGAKHR
jgi:hypothetical protein